MSPAQASSPARKPPSCATESHSVLKRYVDAGGRPRELIARRGAANSTLVIDRDAFTLCDARLVAHLAADEPAENARLVCELFIHDVPARRRCRPLIAQDLKVDPYAEAHRPQLDRAPLRHDGRIYRLIGLPRSGAAAVQLRWAWRPCDSPDAPWRVVCLRDVVEWLQAYEPPCALTARVCAHARNDPRVSILMLSAELRRVRTSSIVLNRGLREAVLAAVRDQRLTLSEISLRCGMLRRDRHGRVTGETSWLARRVGLMPEGGARRSTRWIHTEVLATIARKGLGISPREVELG